MTAIVIQGEQNVRGGQMSGRDLTGSFERSTCRDGSTLDLVTASLRPSSPRLAERRRGASFLIDVINRPEILCQRACATKLDMPAAFIIVLRRAARGRHRQSAGARSRTACITTSTSN